jgi:hypothetical protein
MFQERPQLVDAAFQKGMAARVAPRPDPAQAPRDYNALVREVRAEAERKVDAYEARRRAARDELSADTRWRFVKATEAERLGKDDNGIDPKGK